MSARFSTGLLLCLAFSLGGAALGAPVAGHVEAWGDNFEGRATVPPGLDGVIAVAAGGHNLALRTNGTVVAWGSNNSGETVVPPGLSNVIAIAAYNFSAALKSDGSVVVWGSPFPEITNIPPTAVGVTQIDVSGQSVIALRSDGTVIAWGIPSSQLEVPPGLSNVVQISILNSHVLALKQDGTIVGWGGNFWGQSSHPPGLSNVVKVRAGQQSSMALRADGTLFRWGGDFDSNDIPAGVTGVVDFDLGFQHALALLNDGTVRAWGFNSSGQGSVPALLNGVTAISAGGNHNLVVTARPVIQSITPPVTTTLGANVTLTVSASREPLSYQWQHKGTNLPAGTNASLTIRSIQPAAGGSYAVYVTNPHGYNYTTTSVSLPPPTIVTQPQDRTVHRGENATFSVTPGGFEPFTYQWLKDEAVLANETNATLVLPTSSSLDSGDISVRVTDIAGGSVTSRNAILTVLDPRPVSATFRPVVDTSIHSSGGNPRGVTTILSGTRGNLINDRGLLRFDLSSIPTNAVLDRAVLRLRMVGAPRNASVSSFRLHRVMRPWLADASWTSTGTLPWSAPGLVEAVDYRSNSVPGELAFGVGDYVFGGAEMIAEVSAWVQNPATNHGWILISNHEGTPRSARHFGSSESTTPPELMISYSFPAETPTIGAIRRESTNFVFEIPGQAGWLYSIQTREDVDVGIWTAFTNAPAGAGLTPILISVPATNAHQFFRAFRY
jgi:hypothetical protein